MKDKKAFTRKIGNFLAGKGFYVVLFICTAIIGISAWILLSTGNKMGPADIGSIASTEPDSQDVMVSSNGVIPGLPVEDVLDIKPVVSPKPSAAATPSAVPKESNPDKKASAEDEENSAPVMAKDPSFVWPIAGDIAVVYSVDELIYNKTMSDWRTHEGIDVKGLLGTKVVSAADGTVTDLIDDDLLGTTVIIDHGNGLKSIYANLAKTPVVKKGDKVAMGAVIGAVGDTALGETCEVSHLHYAMTKDGAPVDPFKYLPK